MSDDLPSLVPQTAEEGKARRNYLAARSAEYRAKEALRKMDEESALRRLLLSSGPKVKGVTTSAPSRNRRRNYRNQHNMLAQA